MNDYVRVRYPRYRVTLHGGRIAGSEIVNLKILSIITAIYIYISLFLSLIYSVYKINCNSIIMISKRQEECDSLSRRVVEARGGKKGTERRERCVNNLHSDESIVLRRAHATAPIIALRLAKASTELLHSHPLRARVLHQPPAPFWSLRPLPSPTRYLPTPFSFRTILSRSLAHFSTNIARVPLFTLRSLITIVIIILKKFHSQMLAT